MKFFKKLAAAAALYAALALPAFAGVLWAGGEFTSLTFYNNVAVDTTAGEFNSGYARYSLKVFASPTLTDPPAYYFKIPTFTNSTNFWLHAVTLIPGADTNTSSGAQIIGFYGSDGLRRLLIRASSSGVVKISTRSTGGTIVDLVTCPSGWPSPGPLQTVDINVNYSTTGFVNIYLGGSLFCSYSGDITAASGITSLNDVYFANPSFVGTNFYMTWSELIVSTTDTRSMRLFTCYPASNGTNMTWTGSYTNINGTGLNDASAVYTGSATQTAEFNCPTFPTGNFQIPAVASEARVNIGSSGPTNFTFVTRPGSGSTDYFSGSIAAGTAMQNYNQIQLVNPATGTAWTQADVTGFQQGVHTP